MPSACEHCGQAEAYLAMAWNMTASGPGHVIIERSTTAAYALMTWGPVLCDTAADLCDYIFVAAALPYTASAVSKEEGRPPSPSPPQTPPPRLLRSTESLGTALPSRPSKCIALAL